mgnify:CR=1 FL=1|jgi:hypothetical protein
MVNQKFIVSTLLILVLAYLSGLFLPWYSIAIIGFAIGFLRFNKPRQAFLGGFLAIFILWSLQSFMLSYPNEHILAHRISKLIIQMDNPYLLMAFTGALGGVVSGFACMSGCLFNKEKD